MIKYAVMEDYDSKYKVKNREIACYSKSKMKKLFPDGNFNVIGETLSGNKKKEIDKIDLGGKKFTVSEEDGHSSILFRTVGYVNNGNDEYIALLRRNFLLLWILFGVLAAALVIVLILPKDSDNGILPPDYALVTDDPNAETEVHEDEPDDRVIIKLPNGELELDMKSDTGIKAGETGKARIILTVDGTDYEIWNNIVAADPDGTISGLLLDFTEVFVELKAGWYHGKIIFTAPDGTETTLPVLIIIRDSYGGAVTLGYSPAAAVNRSTGGITIYYSHGLDASHDCVLQLILDNRDKEYLLSQSGVIHPGQSLSTMTLDPDMASRITSGVYHGRLRVNFFNGEIELTNMNTDIEVTITVQ